MKRERITAQSEAELDKKIAGYFERYPKNPYDTVVVWHGEFEGAWLAIIERGGSN